MDDLRIDPYQVRWASLVARVAEGKRDASATIARAHAAARAGRIIVARTIGIAVRRDLHSRRTR
ncbi:MAG: hypothetical protein V7647_2751 [Acidobacteriota bacterium]|jgi:hypothetical protein